MDRAPVDDDVPPMPMTRPFPQPGRAVLWAYYELAIAGGGSEEEKQTLGDPALLPRPWEPASCTDPELRREIWDWLEEVVIWLNQEYAWDTAGIIPACWPSHPHLVHEIAVVADQRRRALLALSSDPMEEWQRYCLPSFLDRMSTCLRSHCDDGHKDTPSRGRHARHLSEKAVTDRRRTFTLDVLRRDS